MSDNITLPRELVEKAIKAFENGCPPTCENGMIDSGGFHPWGEPALVPCPACLAFAHLRAHLAAPSEDIETLRRENERLREALREIAAETYDSWTNGAKAQRIAESALKEVPR